MTVSLKKQLDENLRDSLLAFYLNTVAPHDETTKAQGLKTAQHLYEYWLLDVLVSQDVPTTPVASAIASLQHYINRILMNMEPGYDTTDITPEHTETWRNEMHQYSIWAAHQKLLYFPSTYLNPALRTNKSDNFRQLENDLNQNRIQPDAVQSAVMAYLTRLEEVANLNVLNGYIDGEDFANSTYYFIAKSRSENTYFWRTLNMAQRPLDGPPPQSPAIPPKLDLPDPYAWSDWEKADVPISDNAIEHTIRPVWFNNRLFVVWAECTQQDMEAVTDTDTNSKLTKSNPQLRLNLCYKKPDKSWSTPRTYLKTFINDDIVQDKDLEAIKPLIGTIAVYRHDDSQSWLFMALALHKKAAHTDYAILKTASLDSNLTLLIQKNKNSETHIAYELFENNQESSLQYRLPRQTIVDLNNNPEAQHNTYTTTSDDSALQSSGNKEDEHTADVTASVTLEFEHARILTPKIINKNSTQYIDFSGSKISSSDNKNTAREPIRLNTTFTAEMIRRLENSLDELFRWETQQLPEPKISGNAAPSLDFHGPYGRYFTELFLYLPWLVAQRLNDEHRYDEAERWLRYAFEPSRKKADCWRAVPLVDSNTPSYADQAPHDPHQIALSHPVHFRKALYFLYLDILINRGDAAYRVLTPDSLAEAKLWYVRALDLLGPRPMVRQVDQWPAISLHTLSETPSESLRAFERANASDSLLIREGGSKASLPPIDSPHLRLPFNPELLKRWDIVENRLYNLRHNLDISGKSLHLPLFASPMEPRTLLGTPLRNSSGGAFSSLPTSQIPHYRFSVMHSQALNAVEGVSQFGATLLSLIERKEQVQLQELQQQQAWDLAKLSVDLQTQALRIDHQNRLALLASKAIVQSRANHYQQLLEKDVSEAETQAGQLYLASGVAEHAASMSQAAAGGLMLIPNIFGFSNGGCRWEGTMHAASALAQGAANGKRTAALHLDRTAQFDRRRQEWTLTRDQARLELAQIDVQLAHIAEQETATRLQLRLAASTLEHAKTNYDFLSKRFTKTQLYQWLNSQFATLYRQAYDATLALCLAAEACWQYENADFSVRFFQTGAWNATYRGLGAGEQLKLSLLKMQAEYLQRHKRELEIRKTVSLRLLKSKTATSTINKDWADIHTDLKKGKCEFELTHELFEDDYKDQMHYLRRIKTISVSLPTIIGPYENIRATLTQNASKVFMSPGDEGLTLENLQASQQIALSTGVDDNGLFTLNFNDERYLPFEYTGAISKWVLTFPNPEAQAAMLGSLTDIIVHVSYTARVGGGSQ